MTVAPTSMEFWFEFASTYSYPAAMRIEDAARAAGFTTTDARDIYALFVESLPRLTHSAGRGGLIVGRSGFSSNRGTPDRSQATATRSG